MLKFFINAALAVVMATTAYSPAPTFLIEDTTEMSRGGSTPNSTTAGGNLPFSRDIDYRVFYPPISTVPCHFARSTKKVSAMTDEEVLITHQSRNLFTLKAYKILRKGAEQAITGAGIPIDHTNMFRIMTANPLEEVLSCLISRKDKALLQSLQSKRADINSLFLVGDTAEELKTESLELDRRVEAIKSAEVRLLVSRK